MFDVLLLKFAKICFPLGYIASTFYRVGDVLVSRAMICMHGKKCTLSFSGRKFLLLSNYADFLENSLFKLNKLEFLVISDRIVTSSVCVLGME